MQCKDARILGSCWDHIGISFGILWHDFCLFWGSVGIISVIICWRSFGMSLELFWGHVGIRRRRRRRHVLLWFHACFMPCCWLVGVQWPPRLGRRGGEKKKNVRVVFMLVSRWFHGAGFRPVSCWFQCAVCFHACFMGGFMGPVSCLNFGPVS